MPHEWELTGRLKTACGRSTWKCSRCGSVTDWKKAPDPKKPARRTIDGRRVNVDCDAAIAIDIMRL